jgi:hypothetical protein
MHQLSPITKDHSVCLFPYLRLRTTWLSYALVKISYISLPLFCWNPVGTVAERIWRPGWEAAVHVSSSSQQLTLWHVWRVIPTRHGQERLNVTWSYALCSCTLANSSCLHTVAYRPFARQRPRSKQWVQLLICNKQINKGPFLNFGLVNMFPRKRHPGYRWATVHNNNRKIVGVMFSVESAPRLYSEDPRPDEWVQLRDIRRTATTRVQEAEDSQLLGAVAREQLLEAQQPG